MALVAAEAMEEGGDLGVEVVVHGQEEMVADSVVVVGMRGWEEEVLAVTEAEMTVELKEEMGVGKKVAGEEVSMAAVMVAG